MKKLLVFLMVIICIFSITTCSYNDRSEMNTAEIVSVEGANYYRIGVIVYNTSDDEVVAFRHYLENYIEKVFPGVTFIYSDNISTEEEELDFIQSACDEGADGFLSFLSMDLEKEVELCARNKAYYILASGSVSDEAFQAVADDPYFIGQIGPGSKLEYETGSDMAEYFAESHSDNTYFILSGGAAAGNEMHLQRTLGILDKLQEVYGVNFPQTSEELAASQSPVHASAGDLSVCVMPGYIRYAEAFNPARDEYQKDQYDVVLSVLPIVDMAKVVKGARLGVVDSYTDRNLQLFTSGQLCYVAGKYSSIIGPSFAAMYNAVTGYAEDFREDGRAFRLTQGFWCSADYDDYVSKYGMANSVVTNAYNYEDLGNVCKTFNPKADLNALKELIGAYTYEDAKTRREHREE